ncbi:hypothetical protein MKQ70_21935 [Chitinophaga sedimenti]|uniref:hypothetical protein n=1 Tax=Chitinophaga sedimenti TaxID=2033606 RepID=UPI0020038E65|nr:hypothetical protein [Chitinophaga sedimenti]MCK7557518.1 hypothetical protein [Chitinophaga sedimenti]
MNNPLRTAVRVLFASGLVLAASNLQAQMKIGDRPYVINKASVLELESDRQGLLLPRVQPGMLTSAPLNAAPDGMIVVVENATNQDQVLYLRKNGAWVRMALLDESNSNWSRNGNVVGAGEFFGSTNAAALLFRTDNVERMAIDATGRVSIGSITPTEIFNVAGNANIDGNALISGAISAASAGITGAVTAGSATVSGTTTTNVLSVGTNATVTGTTTTAGLSATGAVNMSGLADNTTYVDVLVIDPTTGVVNRRKMSAAAFNNAISTMNGSTEADQTLVTGSTGNDFNIASVAGVHTFNIPTIGAGVNRGLITLADWQKLQDAQKQLTVNAFSTASDANGLSIGGADNNELTLHPADATRPGGVSVDAQTFGGAKTFAAKVTASAGLEVTGATMLNNATEIAGALTLNAVDPTAATGPYKFLLQGASGLVESRAVDIASLENGVNRIGANGTFTAGPDVTFGTATTGTDFNISVDATNKLVNFNLPNANGVAGAEVRGVVSTSAQSFAGNKSFTNNLAIGTSAAPNSTLQVAGSMSLAIKTVDDAYTLNDLDNTVLVDASTKDIAIGLPAPVNGRVYTIKKIGNGGIDNEVVITPAGSALIDGGPSVTIYNDWTFITLQSDGTNWFIIRK